QLLEKLRRVHGFLGPALGQTPFQSATWGGTPGGAREAVRPADGSDPSSAAPARERMSPAGGGRLELHQEVSAAVLGPAGVGLRGARGPLLAVAPDADRGGIPLPRDRGVACRLCPPLAERHVVSVGAALVGVPLDQDLRSP